MLIRKTCGEGGDEKDDGNDDEDDGASTCAGGGALKRRMSVCRTVAGVEPSRRSTSLRVTRKKKDPENKGQCMKKERQGKAHRCDRVRGCEDSLGVRNTIHRVMKVNHLSSTQEPQ